MTRVPTGWTNATITLDRKHPTTLSRTVLAAIGVTPGDRLSMIRRCGGAELRSVGPSVAEQTAARLPQDAH